MLKKYFQKLMFSLLVVFFTFSGLFIYLKVINQEQKKDEGFAGATPTKSNKFVCEANDFSCVKSLIVDLNGLNENVLLLGNSQLGAINQFSKGEINYAHKLSIDINKNRDTPLTLRSIWVPNATLAEFKEIYLSIRKCKTEIDNLILPLFLDDTREQTIRKSLQNYSSNICSSSQPLSRSRYEKESNLDNISNSDKLDKTILKRTLILKDIQSINSHFRVLLYKLRNSIFGIKASSKRKLIPSAYKFNTEALENIIDLRESSSMPTMLYIPPLLHFASGKEIPYFKDEYLNFKNEMKYICDNENCIFFDLDSIIPDNKWGYKNSTNLLGENKELDFMHFTYDGHQIISKRLNIILNNFIKE